MATFTADKAKSGIQARRLHAGTYVEVCLYSSSATMSAGDIIQMCKVQAGERVIDVAVSSPTEPVELSVGDGLDVDKYVNTATVSTSFVKAWANTEATVAAATYEYSADDTVDVFYSAGQTANANIDIVVHVTKTSDN